MDRLEQVRALRALRTMAAPALVALSLAACATPEVRRPEPFARVPSTGGAIRPHGTDAPYQVNGRWYYPHAQPSYDEVGLASWYGAKFHNRHTADGEVFDQDAPSAAHTTLPLPSIVEVTNLANGKRIQVRLNDRGPFADGRILDLSRAAAVALGFERQGVTQVRVRYLGPATTPAPAVGPVAEAAEGDE